MNDFPMAATGLIPWEVAKMEGTNWEFLKEGGEDRSVFVSVYETELLTFLFFMKASQVFAV